MGGRAWGGGRGWNDRGGRGGGEAADGGRRGGGGGAEQGRGGGWVEGKRSRYTVLSCCELRGVAGELGRGRRDGYAGVNSIRLRCWAQRPVQLPRVRGAGGQREGFYINRTTGGKKAQTGAHTGSKTHQGGERETRVRWGANHPTTPTTHAHAQGHRDAYTGGEAPRPTRRTLRAGGSMRVCHPRWPHGRRTRRPPRNRHTAHNRSGAATAAAIPPRGAATGATHAAWPSANGQPPRHSSRGEGRSQLTACPLSPPRAQRARRSVRPGAPATSRQCTCGWPRQR